MPFGAGTFDIHGHDDDGPSLILHLERGQLAERESGSMKKEEKKASNSESSRRATYIELTY